MPRKIQPNQIVTYPKKIVYTQPENKTSGWEEFLKLFAIQIVAILAGSLTAGVGTALVETWGFSQFGIALTSTLIQSSINFGINETYDAVTNNRTTESTLFNLLFSITDIGKFGRALKQDKLLKIISQNDLLTKVGLKSNVKNFFEIKQQLLLKNTLIFSDKTIMTFSKKVTDAEVLQTILNISTAEMKKTIKTMSIQELKVFLEVEKTLHKINSNLLPTNIAKLNQKKYDNFIFKKTGNKIDDFFKMNDDEALIFLEKLRVKNLGNANILKLSRMRVHAQFQQEFLQQFKSIYKNLKTKVKKLNPFTYVQKIINNSIKKIDKVLDDLAKKAFKKIPNLNKTLKNVIKKYNLIPCQQESFLLGYRFTPTSLGGEGLLEIWKKPYIWKKTPGKVSNYNKIRVFANIALVTQFGSSTDQNKFYKETWELGRGFSQSTSKKIGLISPGISKIYKDVNKLITKTYLINSVFKAGLVSSLKSYSEKKLNQIFNKTSKKTIEMFFSKIPGVNWFAPDLTDLILGSSYDYRKTFNRIIRKPLVKKIKKVRVVHV